MVPFSFAGETFVASADGALHWPAQQALLVADLHLEKASWFARLGQFLPPYDSVATLTALSAVVESTGVRKLYCLGDSFHDRFGCERLPEQARSILTEMTNRLEWTWILGNHDPGFADHCGGMLIEEMEVAGIVLRHEAHRDDPRPELSGHFHPKYRVNMRGRHVSRRCFVASDTKLILPAFGSLTGGLDASHPEIIRQVGPSASALVPLSDRMLRFPIAASRALTLVSAGSENRRKLATMESQRHYLERRALEEEAAAERASTAKAREIHIELASRYRVAADTDVPTRPEPPAMTILPSEFRILD